jgi:iron complex outermembrane receptor protein
MTSLYRTILLGSTALALATTVAFAQDTPPAAADDGKIEKVTVTARRTKENIQQVPGSVSAFSEKDLERIGATDSTGLQGAVPNLNIVQGRGSSNATNIYIRGVGQPDALQTFDPAIGFYVDDVYYSRIRGTQFDLFDIERIEVLRGPQGTLYGKNTIGGALKVVTRRPDQDERGSLQLTVGDYGQFEGRAAASGGITDTLAGGMAVFGATRDGYVTNPVTGEDYNDRNVWAGRVQLAWDPSSTFSVDFSADYADEDNALVMGQATNTLVSFAGALPIGIIPASGPPEFDFHARATPGLPNSTAMTHWGTSAGATWDVSEAFTLRSITAYRNLKNQDYVDIDATQFEFGDVFVDVDQNQFSQELQAIYESDRWTFVGGLYYLKENITSHQEAYGDDLVFGFFLPSPPFPFPNPPATFFLRTVDDDLQLTSWAAFANATYALTDRLNVSAGVRYTDEEKDYFRTTSTFSNNFLLISPSVLGPDDKGWTDLSPMVSIDYQASENVLLYGRFATGFKSGGFNGRANTPQEEVPYDPETMTSYELGLKSDLLDDTLRANVAVFYNDYQDFQARVQDTSNTVPPVLTLSVLNAGQLEIYGAELELLYAPTPALRLDAQIGYLDAQYGKFDDLRFTNFGGSRAFQTPAFSPEWTMRFGGSYGWDLADLGELRLGASARFRSEMALAIDNTPVNSSVRLPGMWQDDYWLYDAQFGWTSESGLYSATIFGRNLFDEVYKTDAQEFSNVGGIRTAYFGAPRTVSFTFTARY